jgi:UDP-N-acetylglucosamine 2-epimerase (non-hydrolysing)
MKILVVFGTRPEAIKLFPVIYALREDPLFDVKICVTGQHRQMLDQVLEIAGLKPDFDLDLMKPNQSLVDVTSRILKGMDEIIARCAPDRVIVQGDTTTAMAAALSAFYRKVPVDHVEAGLRSGDIYSPWPEELNRKLVTSIAALHFAPTARSADSLIRENVPPDRVFVTGNTVIDALLDIKARSDKFPWVREALDGSMLADADGRRIILVTSHRRENFEGGLQRIVSALTDIAAREDCFLLFPVHPNPNVREPVSAALGDHPRIKLLPPLEYVPFVHVLSRCHLVLTDSGGIQEEAPALGKPVLVMRDNTERPEGVDAGTALLVGTEPGRIVRETFRLLDDDAHYNRMSRAHNPFGDGKASQRIRDILRSQANSQTTSAMETLRHAS